MKQITFFVFLMLFSIRVYSQAEIENRSGPPFCTLAGTDCCTTGQIPYTYTTFPIIFGNIGCPFDWRFYVELQDDGTEAYVKEVEKDSYWDSSPSIAAAPYCVFVSAKNPNHKIFPAGPIGCCEFFNVRYKFDECTSVQIGGFQGCFLANIIYWKLDLDIIPSRYDCKGCCLVS